MPLAFSHYATVAYPVRMLYYWLCVCPTMLCTSQCDTSASG